MVYELKCLDCKQLFKTNDLEDVRCFECIMKREQTEDIEKGREQVLEWKKDEEIYNETMKGIRDMERQERLDLESNYSGGYQATTKRMAGLTFDPTKASSPCQFLAQQTKQEETKQEETKQEETIVIPDIKEIFFRLQSLENQVKTLTEQITVMKRERQKTDVAELIAQIQIVPKN